MRNVGECFFWCYHANALFCNCKTVEQRSWKSRDLLQTGEFTSGDKVTHFCFYLDSFQCSCMRTVARLFLRVSSISAHGEGRDHSIGRCVWKHSILARSVFVLHGHRLCRDVAVVLIASIAIWIPDVSLYFYRETGNWRFTGSEIRCIPHQEGVGRRRAPSSLPLPLSRCLWCVCLGGREAGRSGGGDKKWQIADFREGQLEAHGWLGERSDRHAWMTSGEIWSGRDTTRPSHLKKKTLPQSMRDTSLLPLFKRDGTFPARRKEKSTLKRKKTPFRPVFNKERRRPSQLLLSEKKEDRIWMRKAPFFRSFIQKEKHRPDRPSFLQKETETFSSCWTRTETPSILRRNDTSPSLFKSKDIPSRLFFERQTYRSLSKKRDSQIFPSSSLAKIKKKETPALPFSKRERHLLKTGRPLRGFFTKKSTFPHLHKTREACPPVPWGKKRTTIPSLKKNTPSPPTTDTIPSLYLQKYKHRPFCCYPFSKKEKDMSFPSWKEIPLPKKDA